MNYLYIKKYADVNGYELPNYKKIGMTNDVERRRKQLSGTQGPIFVETVCSWEFPDDNAKAVEKAIHGLLGNLRSVGEWFIDEDDSITDSLSTLMEAFNINRVGIADTEEQVMVKQRDNNLATIMEDYITKVKAECKLDFDYKCNAAEITVLSRPNTFYLQMRKTKDPRLVVTGNIFKNNFDKIKSVIGRNEAGIRMDEKSYDCGYWDLVTPTETAKIIGTLLRD